MGFYFLNKKFPKRETSTFVNTFWCCDLGEREFKKNNKKSQDL